MAAPGSWLTEGTLVGGYRLESLLGRGGLAEVWQAHHAQRGTACALKLLHQTAPEHRRRLLNEGRIQSRLDHPGVVRVTEIIAFEGRPGLVMELVEGPSLRALLSGGSPAPTLALQLAAALLEAVAHAHAAGVVHRDLKPENILLQPRGGPGAQHPADGLQPRVIDFGLAKTPPEAGGRQTRIGLAMGTPGYMAPEQYRDAADVDARADVFALGCILYELVTGHPAFLGDDPMVLHRRAEQGDFHPPEHRAPALEPALGALISQALRPDPAERPADAGAMLARWRPTHRHNLTAPVDTFVGRVAERGALGALLGQSGVVTVLGPGGMGKTRLVRELARDGSGDFPGGAWFCDLSEAEGLAGVVAAVSQALGVPPGREEPVVHLGNALAARGRLLLVLDNFEQVARHAERTVGRWRTLAPEAVFVVTSRAVLGVDGERVFSLGPMNGDQAAALFVSRARAHSRGFSLDRVNAGAVPELMRLLDRMPLAIELAAARTRVLSPAAMVTRMGQRFQLLRGRKRGATLSQVIDWSWSLLEADEKEAFAQLSVFQGGFTLAAAQAVLDLEAPADLVHSLRDKSLLRDLGTYAPGDRLRRESRFSMFLSLQDYAAGKLRDAGQLDAVRARHAAHFAPMGRPEALAGLDDQDGPALWWTLSDELDNLLAAAHWAIGRREVGLAEGAALAACEVFQRRGPFRFAIALVEQILALSPEAVPPRQHQLLHRMAVFRKELGEPDTALALLARALPLSREAGDAPAECAILTGQGMLHRAGGRLDEAYACLEAALAVSRASADARGERHALSSLGTAHQLQGRLDEAALRYEQSLRMCREAGDRRLEGSLLSNMGLLSMLGGRLDEAVDRFEAALALYEETGEWGRNRSGPLCNLAMVLQDQGRLDEAAARYGEALAAARAIGHRRLETVVLSNLGSLQLNQGRLREASARYLEALEVSRAICNRPHEAVSLGNLGVVRRLQGRLDEANAHYEAALAIHRSVGNRRFEGIVNGELAMLLRGRGRSKDADAHFDQALACLTAVDDSTIGAYMRGERGLVLQRQGKLEEARQHYEAALAVHQSVGNRRYEGVVRGYLGALLAEQGQPDTGRAMLQRGEVLLRESGDRLEHCRLLTRLAHLDMASDRGPSALEALRAIERFLADEAVGPESELAGEAAALRAAVSAP